MLFDFSCLLSLRTYIILFLQRSFTLCCLRNGELSSSRVSLNFPHSVMTNRRDVNTFVRTLVNASVAMVPPTTVFTNTAKLPIETVKRLISAVARRPNLWMRNHNGQKRSDVNILWYEVSQEVHLPVDICRIKWGHLRDNFRKVFIRNTLSDEPPTTWRFYSDMRFMETSVSENVLRQNRLKDENRFWPQEMQQKHFPIFPSHSSAAAVAACATLPHHHLNLRESLNHEEQQQHHQFGFSMPSIFNNHDSYQNKRIKLENDVQSMSSSNKDNSRCSDIKNENSVSLMSDDYAHAGNDNNDDDDDEFDEDAATEETDRDNNNETDGTSHIENRAMKNGNGDIYTIELFDDDDINENEKSNKLPVLSVGNSGDAKSFCFNKITLNSSNNTNSPSTTTTNRKNTTSLDQDADRMFLLSLLPFLQKVNGQRKLHVRQKLQNVLIDEFG